MPPISNLLGFNAALPVTSLTQYERLAGSLESSIPIRKSDYETIGIISVVVAAAGALASRLWRGRTTVSTPGLEEQGADPYRSPGARSAQTTRPVVREERFEFLIPATHGRMDFENVTLSSRVRLDTKLDFKKIGNSWWVIRSDYGRCTVRLPSPRSSVDETVEPRIFYPVRFDETVMVNGEAFSLSIEPSAAVSPDPLLNTDVSSLNREILVGNWEAIRRAGACIGMIEPSPMRAADLASVGVPSAVFVYLHRETGRILALVHNGRHPRPYEGVPQEIRNRALPVRLDLMPNDLARENDRRHIARYRVQGEIPEALRPFLDALAGQMFQPLKETIDARRLGSFP